MDFIHRIPNLLSEDFCKDIIEKFEKSSLKKKGASYKIINGKVIQVLEDTIIDETFESNKKSTDISIYPNFLLNDDVKKENWDDLLEKLHHSLFLGLQSYTDEHDIINVLEATELEGYNIQKYLPGEGFFNWHCENPGYTNTGDRILAWMIYLNDLETGGTHFKSQNHTEKAEAGKFVIWPAFWTHFHKGQISETETKYIITGWYHHIND
jgi:hypothetical protein